MDSSHATGKSVAWLCQSQWLVAHLKQGESPWGWGAAGSIPAVGFMTRSEAIQYLGKFTDAKLRNLWDHYKVWAFTTAYHIIRKSHGSETPFCSFAKAVVWTSDSAASIHASSDQELFGFVRWNTEAGPAWTKALNEVRERIKRGVDPEQACGDVAEKSGISFEKLLSRVAE